MTCHYVWCYWFDSFVRELRLHWANFDQVVKAFDEALGDALAALQASFDAKRRQLEMQT